MVWRIAKIDINDVIKSVLNVTKSSSKAFAQGRLEETESVSQRLREALGTLEAAKRRRIWAPWNV